MEKENLILTKSKEFAVQIIVFYHFLTEKKEFDIGRQILRSGIAGGEKTSQLYDSCKELIKLLVTIIKKTKENAKK